MASVSDVIALVSSVALRVSIYIFLRWVSCPRHLAACLNSTPLANVLSPTGN